MMMVKMHVVKGMTMVKMVKMVKAALTWLICSKASYAALIFSVAAVVVIALATAPAFATSIPAQSSALSPQSSLLDSGCGLRRGILVRFEDGEPASGVTLQYSAAPAELGGPQFYTHSSASDDPSCTPVITGTLTATTNSAGLVEFDHLGEGVWVLTLRGNVDHKGQVGSLISKVAQGAPPYGTGGGGGFQERVSAYTEHGSAQESNSAATPESRPSTDTTPTTSVYVLLWQSGTWTPSIDLADASSEPYPLSTVPTPADLPSTDQSPNPPTAPAEPTGPIGSTAPTASIASTIPASSAVSTSQPSSTGPTEPGRPAESMLSQSPVAYPAGAAGAPGPAQQAARSSGQPTNTLVMRVGLMLLLAGGGVTALIWARRRARASGEDQ